MVGLWLMRFEFKVGLGIPYPLGWLGGVFGVFVGYLNRSPNSLLSSRISGFSKL